MIKKVTCLIIMCVYSILLFSCYPYIKSGIENYDPSNSTVSLLSDFLPSDDFIEKFEYVDADYCFVDTGMSKDNYRETAIMNFEYSKDTYNEVKTYIFSKLIISEECNYEYNGYDFYVNLGRLDKWEDGHKNYDRYPYEFNMVSFNDEKRIVVFMALYIPDHTLSEKDKELLTFSDMGLVLEEYFSYHNFNIDKAEQND